MTMGEMVKECFISFCSGAMLIDNFSAIAFTGSNYAEGSKISQHREQGLDERVLRVCASFPLAYVHRGESPLWIVTVRNWENATL